LYADLRLRCRVTAIDEIGSAETERDHVRGSGSVALSPLPHCRCADGARSSSRRHSEQESYSGSFADFFCTRARSSHHVPNLESGRRTSLPSKPISRESTPEPKNQGLRRS